MRALSAALAPGMGMTGIPPAMASVTSQEPGSLMPGMPASETTAMIPPFLRASMSSSARSRSLCWWKLTVGVVMAKWLRSFCGLAGVFAGDAVGVLRTSKGAEGDVFEVADGSGDEVEAGSERSVGHCLKMVVPRGSH